MSRAAAEREDACGGVCATLSKPVWMHSASQTIIQYITRHWTDEPPRSGLTTMSAKGRLELNQVLKL